MNAKRELTQQVVQRYRGAARKEKSQILTEFAYATGYNRSYAATLLQGYPEFSDFFIHTEQDDT
jgi:hypothetical protein